MKYKNNNNLVQNLSYDFALKIIKLSYYLKQQNECVLAKQIVASGTSIGTNVEEALAASSKKEFIYKISIASKEAREAHYWLKLLHDSNLLPPTFASLITDVTSLKNITAKIVKTSQNNLKSKI